MKVNLDGEGDSAFFNYVVGFMTVVPIVRACALRQLNRVPPLMCSPATSLAQVLPIFLKLYVRFFGGLEMRMLVKDSAWS